MSGEHEIGEHEDETRPQNSCYLPINPLMRCYDQGQEAAGIGQPRLSPRLVKQPVTFPFGQCGSKHVVGSRHPTASRSAH